MVVTRRLSMWKRDQVLCPSAAEDNECGWGARTRFGLEIERARAFWLDAGAGFVHRTPVAARVREHVRG
jgi:hypothetical protein